jgi:hypothetical protein
MASTLQARLAKLSEKFGAVDPLDFIEAQYEEDSLRPTKWDCISSGMKRSLSDINLNIECAKVSPLSL